MTDKPVPVASAQAGFARKPGHKLPNGAIILVEVVIREFEFRRDSLVLAVNEGSFQPFASWHRLVTTDSPLATGGFHTVEDCMYGQYSSDLEKAVQRFNERVQEKQRMFESLDEANEEGRERLRLESRS